MAGVAERTRPTEPLLSRVAFHPLLFAAYPVILLYSDNVADVSIEALLVPLFVVVALALLIYLLIRRRSDDPRRPAIALSAIIVPVLMIGLVRDIFAPEITTETERGTLVALATAVAIASLGVFLATRTRWVGQLTQALNVLAIVLIGLALVPIGTFAANSWSAAAADAPGSSDSIGLASGAITSRPDIYHLVFDRYGSAESLRLGHGIDNADFIDWLRTRGFHVVDDSYANYQKTTLSLASTLSMTALTDLSQQMGPNNANLAPLVDRLRNSRVGAILQGIGYRYIHLGSWYGPTSGSDIADSVLHPAAQATFTDALLSRSIFSLTRTTPQAADLARDAAEYQWSALDTIATEPGPKYVMAHVLLPHPPYIYLADGTFAPGEATFESQLEYTNGRIQDFVESLLAVPELERPIIVLQADEGPFPERYERQGGGFDWTTATDEELVTKFGILNAMYLPGPGGAEPLPDPMTAGSTYVELLRRYFGATIDDLPNATYALQGDRTYDLIDITERLEQAEARVAMDHP